MVANAIVRLKQEPIYAPLPLEVQERADSYEGLCDLCREYADQMDEGRFVIGDVATRIEKEYGRDKIGSFADDIDVSKGRVVEYRTVVKFYGPLDDLQDFRRDHPSLRYAHFRIAKALKDRPASFDFLEECAKNGWKSDQAAIELKKRMGKHVPEPPIISSAFCNIKDLGEERYVLFEIPDKATWLELLKAHQEGRGLGLLMTLKADET